MEIDIEMVRGLLELLYFASGPILAIAALLGLRQLSIARKTAAISSKRDALRASSEGIRFYLNELVPRYNSLVDFMNEGDYDVLDTAAVTEGTDGFKVTYTEVDNPFEQIESIGEPVLYFLNGLESFSAPLINGVADERVAFSAVGQTFCFSVRRLMPILAITSREGKYFRNTLKLYYLWSDRIKREDILTKKMELDKSLDGIEDKRIPYIGSS